MNVEIAWCSQCLKGQKSLVLLFEYVLRLKMEKTLLNFPIFLFDFSYSCVGWVLTKRFFLLATARPFICGVFVLQEIFVCLCICTNVCIWSIMQLCFFLHVIYERCQRWCQVTASNVICVRFPFPSTCPQCPHPVGHHVSRFIVIIDNKQTYK